MGTCISRKQPERGNAADQNVYINPPEGNYGATARPIKARAIFTYVVQNPNDLPFQKGDILYIISQENDPWWKAEHAKTRKQGLIPSNYVVIDDGSPASADGWFDINHAEADRKLLLVGYKQGTYILRPCSDPRHFALSVRCYDQEKNFFVVKHYKIRFLDVGGYFISHRNQFPDIRKLIEYYTQHADGLCCRLADPFPKVHRPPIQFREMEVNRKCISLDRMLGNGSFGEVWLAKWNGVVDVAVKMLLQNSMAREKFIDEARMMHRLHHPRIVQILGVCTAPASDPVYIITELMTKGSLLQYLRGIDGLKMSLQDLLQIMHQVADGMSYLEENNFVHRDLRAANILVGEDTSVKVADFGLARITEENEYTADAGTKFPVKWTAPEAGLHRTFSIKSDVWSFGVLAYEIVTYGDVPYKGFQNRVVLHEVQKGYRLPNPRNDKCECPTELYELMLLCWDAVPEKRPTFSYLKSVLEDYCVATEGQYVA